MKDKWDLTHIYKNEEEFMNEVKDVKERIHPGIAALEGKPVFGR